MVVEAETLRWHKQALTTDLTSHFGAVQPIQQRQELAVPPQAETKTKRKTVFRPEWFQPHHMAWLLCHLNFLELSSTEQLGQQSVPS
ncbi:hypothetical protein CU100_15235 [Phyllobacterium endophyticum]|uniref:Uncharacterized protein n=1 Tax=Phyllobacterium endophyticum TaxID=1149773 RepID=A0A2P7AR48_9HYPH|nr:hypothetical protein CU100_15235 [Phyllobacterium endophyticum]